MRRARSCAASHASSQAWDLYYQVFRRINKQLPQARASLVARACVCVRVFLTLAVAPQLMTIELQYVSPRLLRARDLELAVPGTYRAGQPVVRIARFAQVGRGCSARCSLTDAIVLARRSR